MKPVTFVNDDNVVIELTQNNLSDIFRTRINSEKIFRKINTFLIKNNIISKNIIDSGSWIGDNTVPWAKNINGIVYAIDPSKENLEFIEQLKTINSLTNIVTICGALSDKIQTLYTNENLHHCEFNTQNKGTNKIESTTLDVLLETGQVVDIGYIHLDVEGMEHLVIKGSPKMIDLYRPLISFEQHLETDNYLSLCKDLKVKNYSVYLINETLSGCRHDCRNLLSIPTEKLPNDFVSQIENFLNIKNILSEL